MGDATKDAMVYGDMISWNALMWGYAHHGRALKAILLFEAMKESKVLPPHITFIYVLPACNHGDLEDEACEFFDSMIKEHGKLQEAMPIIQTMPIEPDRAVRGGLLSACRIHGLRRVKTLQ
ncbi:hypothetical protein AMTR_s00045p00216860 [Amborella trichopoda]|uniref:Pentacotripeptide-repeat region of PRORP domain-containing protein n=1 Tax=Amborella trichopoda TaxID=13333 RepID=W1P5K0_AMBTC|nr:hypothetical protein AMTR_s00045p00216860 [Amborella trichopoda]